VGRFLGKGERLGPEDCRERRARCGLLMVMVGFLVVVIASGCAIAREWISSLVVWVMCAPALPAFSAFWGKTLAA
jgi:hypothetical protein